MSFTPEDKVENIVFSSKVTSRKQGIVLLHDGNICIPFG